MALCCKVGESVYSFARPPDAFCVLGWAGGPRIRPADSREPKAHGSALGVLGSAFWLVGSCGLLWGLVGWVLFRFFQGQDMIFTGHAELTIDPKQRLQIPSKHRALVKGGEEGSGAIAWFCVPWKKGMMMLYTEQQFNELAERRAATLAPEDDEAGTEADFFGLTERLEQDSAGRITIPKLLLDLTGFGAGSEVVVTGAGRRLEVRLKSDWLTGLDDRFKALPGQMRSMEHRKKLEG